MVCMFSYLCCNPLFKVDTDTYSNEQSKQTKATTCTEKHIVSISFLYTLLNVYMSMYPFHTREMRKCD